MNSFVNSLRKSDSFKSLEVSPSFNNQNSNKSPVKSRSSIASHQKGSTSVNKSDFEFDTPRRTHTNSTLNRKDTPFVKFDNKHNFEYFHIIKYVNGKIQLNIIPKSEINSFPIYSNKTQSEIEEITTNVDINEFIRKTDNQILFLNNFVKYNNLWEYHYKIMDENKSTFQIKKLKINSSIPNNKDKNLVKIKENIEENVVESPFNRINDRTKARRMSKSQAKETSESLNCELEQKIKKLEKEKQYLTNSNKNHNYISLTDNKTQMINTDIKTIKNDNYEKNENLENENLYKMKFINFLNEVKFFDIKTPIYDKNYIVKLMKNFNEYWEELNVEENNSSNLNKIKEKLNNIKNTEPVDEPKSSFQIIIGEKRKNEEFDSNTDFYRERLRSKEIEKKRKI